MNLVEELLLKVVCLFLSGIPAALRATGLHVDHVLSTGEWQFHHAEDGLTDIFERTNAGCKWQQEDVEPGDEERDRPGQQQ